jgi:hypothetical protein
VPKFHVAAGSVDKAGDASDPKNDEQKNDQGYYERAEDAKRLV